MLICLKAIFCIHFIEQLPSEYSHYLVSKQKVDIPKFTRAAKQFKFNVEETKEDYATSLQIKLCNKQVVILI